MRSILLHVYDDVAFESRFQATLDLARAFGGHITCVHATPFEDYLATDPLVAAALPEEFSTKMQRLREQLQSRVENRLRAEGTPWDWIHRDEPIARALVRYSALADIVVVSQADAALYQDDPRPLAGAVSISAACPVLVVPDKENTALRLDKPVAIAWNGSPEAAAAVRSSLPILALASSVHLVEVAERRATYPRDMAARYLSRHGVHVDIVERAPGGDIGEALLSAAVELDAGMIVMGAYGRSRLREFLFGGVTRELLSAADVPLLLAH